MIYQIRNYEKRGILIFDCNIKAKAANASTIW